MMVSNDFPIFSDGDIELVIDRKRYKLHSARLQGQSRLIDDLIESQPYLLSKKAREASTVRYVFALSPVGVQDRCVYTIARVELSKNGETGRITFQPEAKYATTAMPLCRYFELVLRALHKTALPLDFTSMATARDDVLRMIDCAMAIGAITAIGPAVECALLGQGQALYLAVSHEPIEWLRIASLLRSRVIYKEAMIHLVGRYKALVKVSTAHSCGFNELSGAIQAVVLRKCKELQEQCISLLTRLVQHQPQNESSESNEISAYRQEERLFTTICTFHRWCGLEMSRAVYADEDLGWSVISNIHDWGNASRLRADDLNSQGSSLATDRAHNIEDSHILDVRNLAHRWAQPLMVNEAELATRTFAQCQVRHFTCTKVAESDYIFDNVGYTPGYVTAEGFWIKAPKQKPGRPPLEEVMDEEDKAEMMKRLRAMRGGDAGFLDEQQTDDEQREQSASKSHRDSSDDSASDTDNSSSGDDEESGDENEGSSGDDEGDDHGDEEEACESAEVEAEADEGASNTEIKISSGKHSEDTGKRRIKGVVTNESADNDNAMDGVEKDPIR